MIKVIIADDHQIVVDGLVSILEDEQDINVVGTAITGNQVLSLLSSKEIDIAILDIEMPGITGSVLSEIIARDYPNIKVLILSMYKNTEIVERIISTGVKGYILKNRGSEELVKAIKYINQEYINQGQSYIGQEITDVVISALKNTKNKINKPKVVLTKREKEVLTLISRGMTSIEIGKKLFIAPSTVDTHRRNLIEKLDVKNSKELIIHVHENPDTLL